jgi:[protein-PII] uridylyltransferase
MVDNHRINIADDKVFERDPVNMLRLFWFADRHGLEFHPDALKLLTRSLGWLTSLFAAMRRPTGCSSTS